MTKARPRKVIPYVILRECRAIRVFHGNLDMSWWKRAKTRGEEHVRIVEDILRQATGLNRIWRIHIRNTVEFRIRADVFDQAAVALRLSIDPDDDVARLLRSR